MAAHPGAEPTDDLELALFAARAAAAAAIPYWVRASHLPRTLKADGSIVTEADVAVESEARRVIATARPGDALLGEETGASDAGPRRWIFDGIDGTANFVAGDDRWQSLIALEVAGQIVVGVAVLPARDQLWWAARGRGAFVAPLAATAGDARRLAVGRAVDLATGRLGILPLYHTLTEGQRRSIERLRAGAAERPWSLHPALLVAAGELDLAAQVGGAVWDYAALSLIVTEAGGVFSDAAGRPHPARGTFLYANDPSIHAAARALLQPPPG